MEITDNQLHNLLCDRMEEYDAVVYQQQNPISILQRIYLPLHEYLKERGNIPEDYDYGDRE